MCNVKNLTYYYFLKFVFSYIIILFKINYSLYLLKTEKSNQNFHMWKIYLCNVIRKQPYFHFVYFFRSTANIPAFVLNFSLVNTFFISSALQCSYNKNFFMFNHLEFHIISFQGVYRNQVKSFLFHLNVFGISAQRKNTVQIFFVK